MADGGKEEKEVVVHENSYEFHKKKVDYYKEKVKNLNQDGVFYLDGKELKFAASSLFIFGQQSKLRFYSVWLATRDHFNNFILLVILVNSLMMGAKDYLDPDNLTQHN